MSANDLWVRDFLTKYVLTLLIVICGILWLVQNWPKLRQRILCSHLVNFEAECSQLAYSHKRRLFDTLASIVSEDEVLRSLNSLRLLEIGVKTGDNIQFYPDGTYLIAVDWNRRLADYLLGSEQSWQFAHTILEKFVIGDGSCLEAIPSGCVDVVVTTRSLCSTTSIRRTLSEIRRVLVPGGKYLFMEHVPEKQKSLVKWLQKFLTSTNIWPSLYGDCKLDSNPVQEIKRAGFHKVDYKEIVLEGVVSRPLHLLLTKRHVIGTAVG